MSRACTITSSTIFSVMALPIWTAPPETVSLWPVSSIELKVAPWIPSRPVRPPIGDDQVARQDRLLRFAPRQKADRSAKDQRIGQVTRVNGQGAVHGGNAHAIAVVAHPGDDSLEHPFGVQRPRREADSGSDPAVPRRKRRYCRSAWPRAPCPGRRGLPRPDPCWHRHRGRSPRDDCGSLP